MSDKTFKHQVEEIVSIALAGECPIKPCPSANFVGVRSCKDCFTDRILTAHNAELDRIAEGIDKGRCSTHERKQIVAYIQAQKEGM